MRSRLEPGTVQAWQPDRSRQEIVTHLHREGLLPAGRQADPPPGDWQRVLRALARRKWLVIAIAVVGTAAGVVVSRHIGPRYTARARLWIGSVGGDHTRDLVTDEAAVPSRSWGEVATSIAVLDGVVRQQRLFLQPRERGDSAVFAGFALRRNVLPGRYRLVVNRAGAAAELQDKNGKPIQLAAAGDSIGATVGFAWAPPRAALVPGRRVEFEVISPYEAASKLVHALRILQDPGGGFLRIELRGADPGHTAATVNAVAERVVAIGGELKRRKFAELARILGGRYAEARQHLQAAEAALQSFRVDNAGITAPAPDVRGDPGFLRTFELRVALEELRRDRRALERAVSGSPQSGLGLEALAAVARERDAPDLVNALEEFTGKAAELRALRYRYTDASAPVRQAQGELDDLQRRAIPDLARGLVRELSARETALGSQVAASVGTLRQAPPVAIEEARRVREVANAEALASSIQQRYEAARLGLVSSLPDVQILDLAAAPDRPALNFGPLIIAFALLSSLTLGVVGVTTADRLDPRVRYPAQVVHQMRLPILAALPHVSLRNLPGGSQQSAEVIEALRGLRIRVLHSQGTEAPLLLTVTSPAAGDGKSFVSVNLALSFAYAGYRTLLIDGDVRRGNQHTVVGAKAGPGLTDLLSEQATLDQAVQNTNYSNLSFIGSGTRMYRAPELLLLPALRELVARAQSRFGVVIVDSPPLAAGVDPLVLATATGNLLLVLRAEATDLSLALAKLDVADSLPVRTIGAVLNCVRGDGAFRHYTYDLTGYEEPDALAGVKREGWRHILGGRPS